MAKLQNLGINFEDIAATNEHHQRAWHVAMGIARLEFDAAQLKGQFLAWAKLAEMDEMDHFAALPAWRFLTIGRAAWLMNCGAEIPPASAEFFLRQLQDLRGLRTEDAPTELEERELTAAGRQTIQYVNFYSRLDALRVKHADDLDTLEDAVRKTFEDTRPAAAMLRKLYQHYKDELDAATKGADNPLVEATVEPLLTVVNVLAASTGNTKAMNALRKKVGSKAVKAASKAVVKTVDTETNTTSLTPALLIGNGIALVYNTKDRKAMVYVAKAGETLGVKGTYITGFDPAVSFGKTLRKPKETFDKILHKPNAKRIAGVLDEYIKGKRHPVNGKLNKDTLILKVFK